MDFKRIVIVTDAWEPQVSGVVTTLNKMVEFAKKDGYDIFIVHPGLFKSKFYSKVYPEIPFTIPFGISKYLKHKVKKAVGFVFEFEKTVTDYCRKRGYDGVICGHIHTPEIKEVEGVMYMNDGDWVESCSALVETLDGEWKIVYWTELKGDGNV